MIAVQSPHHGARGIGRLASNLVSALLEHRDEHEYVFYVHDELPDDRVPRSDRVEYRAIRPRWEVGETMVPCLDRLARTNPDGLDALVFLSPFEKWAHYSPPPRYEGGPKLVAFMHDLIPFLFQNENVVDPVLMRHYHVLETVARYDLFLTNSDATRSDCLAVLRLDPDRVKTIGAASDDRLFVPDRSTPMPAASRRALNALGVVKPFVMNVGGLDPRKNTWKLIEAFAALPAALRDTHQLVLTFATDEWGCGHVLNHARDFGVAGSVVLTGEVTDETLRVLYQRCAAFAFPSLYEGFGLPILEAMHCGAAVIVGNNSSQVEIVGDAALLTNAGDTHDIKDKLATLLADPVEARVLGDRAIERARAYSWESCVQRMLEAFETLERKVRPTARIRFDGGHARKPTIAFFSPLPPRKSGISDYSAFLLEELRRSYQIDLFHDSGYVPQPALHSGDFVAADFRLFDRLAASKRYHAVVYQMGNSRYHSYMYPVLLRHPGLMVLHDFCLAGFHLHYGHSRGVGMGFIAEKLRRWYPEDHAAIEHALATWPKNWDDISRDCALRGWHLNREVLAASATTIFHSPWCRATVAKSSPEFADAIEVIPHGIHPRRTSAAHRAEVRDRFKLPQNSLIVASFGFVHPDKMSPQALDAFAVIARDDPSALFVFAGEEADGGAVRNHAAALGLNDRVRFLGRQSYEDFTILMTATDVGVNLRMPPTNGETSGALLNLLAAGVPSVVTEVATFSDYPSTVVRKVKWETEGPAGLLRALSDLASNRPARQALGEAAWAYVDEHHEWSRVAKLYVDAIERCHESQNRSPSRDARRPHADPGTGGAGIHLSATQVR